MLANSFVVLILFLFHEGFYLLPQSLVVLPGVFRMSDAIFGIIPLSGFTVFQTFNRYREESLLVLAFCFLMLLSCLMGQLFFPQSYLDGLFNIRRNFYWLSFFMFIPLIRNIDQAEKLLKLLTLLVGIYVFLLLLTKYFPDLGIIHYSSRFYNAKTALKRFGESRFFFPYGNIPIMLYCIALARMLHGKMAEGAWTKIFRLTFMAIVFYAAMSSYTRSVVFPLLLVTVFALFTSRRSMLKIAAVALAVLVISVQVLTIQMGHDSSLLQDTKLGKLITKADMLDSEKGRMFQASMYMTNFMRSPLAGVGTFGIGKYINRGENAERLTYKEFGFYGASDLGYLRILCENGLLGIAWVAWWFSYFYRPPWATTPLRKSSPEDFSISRPSC